MTLGLFLHDSLVLATLFECALCTDIHISFFLLDMLFNMDCLDCFSGYTILNKHDVCGLCMYLQFKQPVCVYVVYMLCICLCVHVCLCICTYMYICFFV